MSRKDIDKYEEDYHLMKDEEKHPRIVKKGSRQLKIKEVNENEPSPLLIENTLKNEETLKKLWMVSVICLVFMAIEITGGYLANSIAIMSDAAHLLSDFLGFIISIVSIYISRRGATHQMSFGYHRSEVIGALASVTLIWGLTIWLLFEATLRIISPNEVDGLIMLITAVIGFVFNVVMGIILAYQGIDHNLHHHHEELIEHEHDHGMMPIRRSQSFGTRKSNDHQVIPLRHATTSLSPGRIKKEMEHDHEHDDDHDDHDNPNDPHDHSHGKADSHDHSHENVNLRAALIHVMGDALQNLGVVVAGLIIYFWPKAAIADPICTYIFSIIVVFTTIRILRDCIAVLMEGSPLEFDMVRLENDLKNVKGVVEIHDLHVWSLSVGKLSLSCHLTSNNPQISLRKARRLIKNQYKITHSTIQVELDSDKFKDECKHDLHVDVQNNQNAEDQPKVE